MPPAIPPPRPRWFALPLLALGATGFAAAWMLVALAMDSLCAWLAPLAALDVVLLLRLARWPAGGARAGWGLLATATVIALANFCIAAGQVGMGFGMRPLESALRMGPDFAWQLIRLANTPATLGWYGLALAVACIAALRWRTPSGKRGS